MILEVFNLTIPLLSLHLISLSFVLSFVVVSDICAHAWMRGKKIRFETIKTLHTLVWIGIGAMLITGVSMFMRYSEYLVNDIAFIFKMFFVSALIINGFVISKFLPFIKRPYESLTKKEKTPLIISGMVSTISWVGTIVSALLIGRF